MSRKYYTEEFEGEIHTLTASGWADLTGDNVPTIYARLKKVRDGEREWTLKQCLGIDSLGWNPADNLPSREPRESLTHDDAGSTYHLACAFLRRGLRA